MREGIERLNTLIRLAGRMDDLIASLLHYSRIAQIDLSFIETDLNEVLAHTCEMLQERIGQTGTQIRIPRPLPTILCDRVRVGEIFSNVMTNAMKYNEKSEKMNIEKLLQAIELLNNYWFGVAVTICPISMV